MTDPNITATLEELRELMLSARAGARADMLTEREVLSYRAYVNGHGLGSPAQMANHVTTEEELLKVITRVEAAIRVMRSSPLASTGGNRK